jgi:Cu/Ag efflux protein CusF|tara:strand:- start:689 stop:925 length:237 start_codon:yes stop_codon:yes gene_type:complete
MPVKFGKTSKQIDRQTKKVSIVHEYMKCQSVNTLIEKYNNSSTTKKLKRKIKVEFDRRNKLGLTNIVFNVRKENGILE